MTDAEAKPIDKKKCVICASEIPVEKEKCTYCLCDPDGQQCGNCKKRIPAGATFCNECKSYQNGPQCDNCKKRMPADSKFCNECKSYQSWRQYFNVVAIVLSLATAAGGVIKGLHLGAIYLSERDSHTKFKVTSADDLHIYLRVWNTGMKPSALVGYHLRFNGNPPLKDITLQLSEEDATNARNVIIAGSPAKITLTTGRDSLAILPNAGIDQNTKAKLSPLLGPQTVILDVDVEESDDPTAGFCPWIAPRKFHTRRDVFAIDRIKPFVIWNMR